ncbi:TAXI family TRAP transporter solute-binding subunit [Crocosphaera sp. UHCC 0190]|uniref:TAXI family TRAP transporter solute-binding subunit n=1 Tax=Crocosphaera sp. UHCC 0190 TaxID=3110246 RepID=UPI002B2098E0|nr:TAXI family TRAP transporter solute-binding subunit [Crocosphaera sp. UHCC 0190]MEA5512223.1 TAXI family TRAP transporter solute-binding subunit [Crocosphaera sp. UHCC 0190]
MKKRLYYLLCGFLGVMAMLLIFIPSHTVAQTPPLEINIVTGNEAGEYYSVAKDIEKLALTKNLDIDIIPTKGALQNIDNVFYYQSIPLGITQGDILAFLNTFANKDEEARRQAESIRVVMPLYQEQVHIITRQDIKSVKELTGKRVSIGESGSGTSTTAATLLHQLNINPKKLETFDIKRGIDALREKEIDALFYVVGMPAKVLQEQIFTDDNFHILPLTLPPQPNDDFLSKIYSKAVVPGNTYPWQKEAVETLSVQSFLFSVAEENCDHVTPVAKLIIENLSWLQENGDPIWKQINPKDLSKLDSKRVSKCAVL